MQQMQQRLDR